MSTRPVTAEPLALHGGRPYREPSREWPTWPMFDSRERDALVDVLESGKWWYGDRVRQFEQEFAATQAAKHCVSCTSGTTAAEIVMQALGIGPGDEVIVPPFSFFATASAVSRMGATPVFVDVDDSWNLDPDRIEATITPNTKAIMPVHFGGRVCDMDRIGDIAKRHNLYVVEDACHSWGARWKDKGTGTLGHCGVFSFQASKNITAGEGGAIVTDDDDLAALCRSLTHSGRLPGEEWFKHFYTGTNARITEFAAAILSVQLSRLEEHNTRRRDNAALLDEALGRIDGLTPQPGDSRITRRTYHIYCFRFDSERFGCSRDRFVEAANAEGLPLGKGYPLPLYRQPVYIESYSDTHCPVCEDLCERSAVWLGHRFLLGDTGDMQDIDGIIHKVAANAHQLRD